MNILAIETSTKFLEVAVAKDDVTLAVFREESEYMHSSLLIPAIEKALQKCRLKLKDIDIIALSIGPGSFTGLRIGVAAVKGINLALAIPIVAVATLDVIAFNFVDEKKRALCPVIDAKKGKVYSCFYRSSLTDLGGVFYTPPRCVKGLDRISDYLLTEASGLLKMIEMPTMLFGDGVKLYGEYFKRNPLVSISTKNWRPKGETVAKFGFEKAVKKEFANPDKLVPMYLHSKYCQVQ